ncbi:hypothetical protein [Chlamydia ibidis]|nr:hypothetical protein [Chlamydia ibidis]
MDIFGRLNRRSQFYVDKIDQVIRDPSNNLYGDENKGDVLEKKLLDITKRIVTSAREFQSGGKKTSDYLKKTRWLSYKNEKLEEARELFLMLSSVDQRISQLFFYAPPCGMYWEDFVCCVQDIIREDYGLGGIIFDCGPFEKQCRYVRSLNQGQSVPFLLVSSIPHSLEYYLSHRELSLMECDDLYRLGKEIGDLLKINGVTISLIFNEIMYMDPLKYSDFISGLKRSGNIQGKLYRCDFSRISSSSNNPIALRYSLANTIRGLSVDVDFSSLKFMSCSMLSNTENAIKALNYGGECFTFSTLKDFKKGVRIVAQLISSGKISSQIINKTIMKILTLKRQLNPSLTYDG